MDLKNTTARYGAVSQALHWLIVALIITQYVLAELAEAPARIRRRIRRRRCSNSRCWRATSRSA